MEEQDFFWGQTGGDDTCNHDGSDGPWLRTIDRGSDEEDWPLDINNPFDLHPAGHDLDASDADGGHSDTIASYHQQRVWPPLEPANAALFARVSEQLLLSVLEALVNLPDFQWGWLGQAARACRSWRDAADCERLWAHVCRVQARVTPTTVTVVNPLGDAAGTDSAACSSYRALARERELWVRRVQPLVDPPAANMPEQERLLTLSSRGMAAHRSMHRLWFRSPLYSRPVQPTLFLGGGARQAMGILVAPSGIGMVFLRPDGESYGHISWGDQGHGLALRSYSSGSNLKRYWPCDLTTLLGPTTVMADNQGKCLRFYRDNGNAEASCLGMVELASRSGQGIRFWGFGGNGGDVVPTEGLLKGPIFVAADQTGSLLSFNNGHHTVGGIQGGVRGASLLSTSG